MIKPISFENVENRYNLKNVKKDGNANSFQGNSLSLSNSQIGQAILNRNNISFHNLSEPIERNNKYNKPTYGKDHLDLPNIHVYEFLDTNLQVFIDENEDMENISKKMEIKFCLKNKDGSSSPLKDQICLNMIKKKMQEQYEGLKTLSHNQGLFVTEASFNKLDFDIFNKINQTVAKPNFTNNDLEQAKQKLLVNLSRNDVQNNDYKALLPNESFLSKDDIYENIQKLSIDDINKYYDKRTKNSEAVYFITINKNILNSDSKKELFKHLNLNIDSPFQKHDDKELKNKQFILNNGDIKYVSSNDYNNKTVELHYPFEEQSLKDYYTSLFANFIIIFLNSPYYDTNTKVDYPQKPINLKSDNLDYACHSLKFDLLKPEFTKLNEQGAVKIQKELAKMIYETDFEPTLKDIKNLCKKSVYEELHSFTQNNTSLCKYNYDIFALNEIIDSVDINDVKQHIKKYILEQEPIVYSKGGLNEN